MSGASAEEKVKKVATFLEAYKKKSVSIHQISKQTGLDKREISVILYLLMQEEEKRKKEHANLKNCLDELEYYRTSFKKLNKQNTLLIILLNIAGLIAILTLLFAK
ncbi:MAG: hypothetical protein ABDI07_11180 [Candidatus Kryptonium sp.]